MGMSKKLVTIYVRKSRLKDDDELEISRQIELLTDYAALHNMEYELFHEEGSSEDWNGRTELQSMLKELDSGIYDGVLVTEQDRLSRDSTDIGLFKRICQKHNLILYTLDRTYDFSNDDDNFITGIQAEMDTHFMRIMKRKMLRGRIQALKSGVYFGVAPFGYTKAQIKPKRLAIIPEEAKVVKMIYDMYVNQKKNHRKIKEKVNLLGFLTRENKEFSTRSVKVILENVAYAGVLQYELQGSEPIIVEDAHEAIITRSLFDEAQIIRSKRSRHPPDAKSSVYLLSRLLICPRCKTRLSFCQKYVNTKSRTELDRSQRVPFVLNCYASMSEIKKRDVTVKCTGNGVRLNRLEDLVLENLEQHLVNLDAEIDLIMEEGDELFGDIQSEIDSIDKRLNQLIIQKKRVQEGFQNGIYNAGEAKDIIAKLTRDDIVLRQNKEKALSMNSASEIERKQEAKKKIESVLSGELEDVAESNRILRETIDYIHYFKEGNDSKYIKHPIHLEIVYK